MFITYPLNVDYLMLDVRMRIGDLDATRYSASIVRSAIIGGVKMLQRRWGLRYLIFDENAVVPNVSAPEGFLPVSIGGAIKYVASGLANNDVYRNPDLEYAYGSYPIISQEDEYVVVLAASIILRTSQLTSSAETFQIWSDGEYSCSNASKAKALSGLVDSDIAELDRLFKSRLRGAGRGSFAANILPVD